MNVDEMVARFQEIFPDDRGLVGLIPVFREQCGQHQGPILARAVCLLLAEWKYQKAPKPADVDKYVKQARSEMAAHDNAAERFRSDCIYEAQAYISRWCEEGARVPIEGPGAETCHEHGIYDTSVHNALFVRAHREGWLPQLKRWVARKAFQVLFHRGIPDAGLPIIGEITAMQAEPIDPAAEGWREVSPFTWVPPQGHAA